MLCGNFGNSSILSIRKCKVVLKVVRFLKGVLRSVMVLLQLAGGDMCAYSMDSPVAQRMGKKSYCILLRCFYYGLPGIVVRELELRHSSYQ